MTLPPNGRGVVGAGRQPHREEEQHGGKDDEGEGSWLRTMRAYRSLPQALSGRKAFLMTKKVVRLIPSCSLVAERILSHLRNLDLQSSHYPSI